MEPTAPITTDEATARRFIDQLFEALRTQLADPVAVRNHVERIRDHAPGFPETCFCKGCVLPIVDSVASRFLKTEFAATTDQIHAALRCEGFSTHAQIYKPGVGQSGFSGPPWGSNYQRVGKSGKVYPPEDRGYQPCPDFGIVNGSPKFTILGETKYADAKTKISSAGLVKEMEYYMGIPREPDKQWDYDFGFGIVYAAGGDEPRKAELIENYWKTHRFMIASFQG